MRNPLMWRETHEILLASANEEAERWKLIAQKWEAAWVDRMEKYEALLTKLEAKTSPPVLPARVKREPDEADTAIDFVSMGDAGRRRYLERHAKMRRREGVPPKDIAAEILRGDRSDDEEGVL